MTRKVWQPNHVQKNQSKWETNISTIKSKIGYVLSFVYT